MHFCTNCDNAYYIRIGSGTEDSVAAGAADASADATTLYHYCRNCGNEEKINEAICVSKLQLKHKTQSYSNVINRYTKLDPTLPRINHIKCPNASCLSNPPMNLMSAGAAFLRPSVGGSAGKKGAVAAAKKHKHAQDELVESGSDSDADAGADADADAGVAAPPTISMQQSKQQVMREIIYIRYDEVNMKYVYLCAVCDTLWNTSQNSIL